MSDTLANKLVPALLKKYPLPDDLAKLIYYTLMKCEQSATESPYRYGGGPLHTVLDRLAVDYAQGFDFILSRLPSFQEDGLIRTSVFEYANLSRAELYSLSTVPLQWHTEKEVTKITGTDVGDTSKAGHWLSHTPYANLLKYKLGLDIPPQKRFVHTYILGASESGKTQLLQQLIVEDLKTDASIIVIDSQRDLIHRLIASKLIPPERLVIINPEDALEFPLALNMFDIGQDELSTLKPIEYERHISGVIELLSFVFGSIMDSDLTDKQTVVFNFCIRLMLIVPNATLHSLLDLLENGTANYVKYIARMRPIAQQFFASAFPEKGKSEYNDTRGQISRRLFLMLNGDAISSLFASPKNRMNIKKEMDAGKVILISTDRGLLKNAGCAFFGRFFLSLIAQAMQERATTEERFRKPTFVYVDECGDYLNSEDSNITDILEKGRKYKVGLTLAHQQLSQIPSKVFHSIKTNVATKMIGLLTSDDAKVLKSDMNVESFTNKKLVFDVFIRGVTTHPLPLKVTPAIIENGEQRSRVEVDAVIAENRAKYSIKPTYGTPAETSPITPNEPAYTSPPQPAEGVADTEGVADDIEDFNKA